MGEGFEAAKETGKVTRDELPSVVGPQQNAVGFVNGLLREQRRSLFDHNVHDDLRRSPSLALEDRIEVIVDDVSDLLSDGRLNDIVNFARIHDNILSLSLKRVRSGQRPQNISFVGSYSLALSQKCCNYGYHKDMNVFHQIIMIQNNILCFSLYFLHIFSSQRVLCIIAK